MTDSANQMSGMIEFGTQGHGRLHHGPDNRHPIKDMTKA